MVIHTYNILQNPLVNSTKMTIRKSHPSKEFKPYTLFILISLLFLQASSEGLTNNRLIQILRDSNKSPFVNMLFVYDTNTQTGKRLQQYIPLVTASKKDYYKVNLLDCNTDDEQVMKNLPFCSKQFRDKLPALIYTEPAINAINPETGSVNQAKQHQYQGPLDQKSLFDFAVPLMKAFSLSLNKIRDLNTFIQNNNKVPYLLYFTQKDKLPTVYKALTTHFRNTIKFAHIQNDSPLSEHFNISKFPTMLLNGKQQIPLSKNLSQIIQRLEVVQGQQTIIVISELQSNIQQLSSQNIQKLVYQHPQHILVHIGGQNGQVHPEWKKCQESFKRMFTYYESEALAKQLGVKQTPSIVYFPKSLAKKNVQKTVFYPKDTFRNIYDEISSIIEDFTVPLSNDMQMQKLTSIPLQQDKIIAVLFHQDQISLSYRVLSNDESYKKDIVFFRMKDPQPSVMQKFQIKKLPALYVMINDKQKQEQKKNKKGSQQLPQGRVQMNLQIAQYTGKFNYDDLTKYLSMFSKKTQKAHQSRQDTSKVSLIGLNSQKSFKKHCIDENCFILLIDGRNSNKQNNQNYKNQVKKFAGRVNDNFGVLDSVCHSQILGSLDIQQQELPAFIYLNSKFQKVARLIGRIEDKSLNQFISKIKSNKANYRGYNNLIFNNKKDCAEQHRKIEEYEKGSTSESTLNQDELQILKQIQLEAENKKKQMQKIEKELEKSQRKKRRRRKPKNQDNSQSL